MQEITLYQFELCPYCHKVKAGLDLKGVPYRKVEVNPMNKRELPELPEEAPRKVPVVQAEGETVYDSSTILGWLDGKTPEAMPFLPADAERRAKAEQINRWVDEELTFAIPTVIYGTVGEATKAAQVTARTSNFGFLQNIMVRAGGSIIMNRVSQSILKKRGKSDGRAWLAEEVDRFEEWLGDQDYVCGDELTLGDVSAHGAFSCIREFPAFDDLMKRPKLAAWFERVQAQREQHRAN